MLHLHDIPTWMALVISSLFAIVVAILVQIFVVPWQKKKILKETSQPVKFSFGDSDGKKKFINFLKIIIDFSLIFQIHPPIAVQNVQNVQFHLFMNMQHFQQ